MWQMALSSQKRLPSLLRIVHNAQEEYSSPGPTSLVHPDGEFVDRFRTLALRNHNQVEGLIRRTPEFAVQL